MMAYTNNTVNATSTAKTANSANIANSAKTDNAVKKFLSHFRQYNELMDQMGWPYDSLDRLWLLLKFHICSLGAGAKTNELSCHIKKFSLKTP